ncbi:hypothetical protein Gogos_020582 [Gossypium gossypioides]|uniref:Myb/SANT-like domain-containing protein n=1 Tax=Gossypium gossypioides TaxID=34282 RepID=A0A7J9CZK9_GOSGO|nr:hypothetical protein [Gossypium gossypioides]
MSDFSQSTTTSSQNSRGIERKWFLEEDAMLVACMVELHDVGTFNANTRFKAGYLNKLERMLEKVLPHAMLKAKPNLESRIRILKKDWAIVYDMLRGKDNSGLSTDIVEEINTEDVATTKNLEEGSTYYGCEVDVSLNEMDVLATQLQSLKPNQDDSTFSKKEKRKDF